MTVAPTSDQGQLIASPAGKVIGFIDGKAEFEAFAAAVLAAGYPASKLTSLHGEDGIHLMERLKDNTFFFGDSEDDFIKLSIIELGLGHYVAAVDVTDHAHASEIVNLTKPHGGHGFSYFGPWVTEAIPT